jgi:NADPH:quinone reductase-like Zn-dependent oxidoreductase
MLAVYITGPGKPDVIKIHEVPDPKIGAKQALVKIQAAGINYAEVVVRKGLYPDAPKFPFIPGYEFAGTVENTCYCDTIKPGDRVIGVTMFGGQAEYIAIDESQLLPIPETMSFAQAAAIPVNYLTAYYALFRLGNLRENEKVLIHSCAGGVGTAAVQLALTKQALIFGTASQADKLDYLKRIGVQHPLNYRKIDFAEEISRLTGDKGVDLVLDPVGGPTFRKSYRLLAPGGRIISYGVADLMSGSRWNLPRLLWKFLTLPRPAVLNLIQSNRGVFGLALNRLLSNPDDIRQVLDKLLKLFESEAIKPEITGEYDFREAADAHRFLESGQSTGKLVLKFHC